MFVVCFFLQQGMFRDLLPPSSAAVATPKMLQLLNL
jgi:hypothetical protein